MAVDPRAFVEPAFAERRIDPHGNDVLAVAFASVIVEEIVDLDAERCVAAVVATDDMAVHEDQTIPEYAIELEPHATPAIGRGDGDRAAIPADTVFGMCAADRLEPMRGDRVLGLLGCRRSRRCERQRHRPVVRDPHLLPAAVVERRHRCVGGCRPRLCKGALVATEPEIALDICRVPEMETPVREPLARSRRRLALCPRQRCTGGCAQCRRGHRGQRKRTLTEHRAAGKSWHHILPSFL